MLISDSVPGFGAVVELQMKALRLWLPAFCDNFCCQNGWKNIPTWRCTCQELVVQQMFELVPWHLGHETCYASDVSWIFHAFSLIFPTLVYSIITPCFAPSSQITPLNTTFSLIARSAGMALAVKSANGAGKALANIPTKLTELNVLHLPCATSKSKKPISSCFALQQTVCEFVEKSGRDTYVCLFSCFLSRFPFSSGGRTGSMFLASSAWQPGANFAV